MNGSSFSSCSPSYVARSHSIAFRTLSTGQHRDVLASSRFCASIALNLTNFVPFFRCMSLMREPVSGNAWSERERERESTCLTEKPLLLRELMV